MLNCVSTAYQSSRTVGTHISPREAAGSDDAGFLIWPPEKVSTFLFSFPFFANAESRARCTTQDRFFASLMLVSLSHPLELPSSPSFSILLIFSTSFAPFFWLSPFRPLSRRRVEIGHSRDTLNMHDDNCGSNLRAEQTSACSRRNYVEIPTSLPRLSVCIPAWRDRQRSMKSEECKRK